MAIDGPEFPDGLDHIWKWFCEVSLGIEAGGMGPQVVTWDNVRSWAALMQTDPEPWEALLLVRLGYIRATVLSEKPKPGEA